MPDLHEFWEPDEWEQFVLGLLQDRHSALNVMKVPARHLGDFGLDYYCLADRVLYQCYVVQEPCEVADRADKQKGKITTDLNKLRWAAPASAWGAACARLNSKPSASTRRNRAKCSSSRSI